MKKDNGKKIALQALAGKVTERVPSVLFTWEFDYIWKITKLEPWQLACGGSKTWHAAHLAILEYHKSDIIMYSGAGTGMKDPTLLSEDTERWIVKDNNTDIVYGLTKNSHSLYRMDTGEKKCDSVGDILNYTDADRMLPLFNGFDYDGYSEIYLEGLRNLIDEVGNTALVLPHHSPAYICSCYALGFEKAMPMMLDDPDLFLYICNKFDGINKHRMIQLAEAGANAVFLADGWASCDIISPTMFERFALPYQISITKAAHDAGLKVILWNEGDILPLLEKEAMLDIDAFAFEQPRKGINITVEMVRKVFGKDRCLFGNLDSEMLLKRNDSTEITKNVKEQIRQSGAGSPFILSTGSPIPSDVDSEAVDSMIKACKEKL